MPSGPGRLESTSICEVDPAGGALRYRGVDLRELVGVVPFDRVWGLLVADDLHGLLPPAEVFPLPARTGAMTADVISALASVAPVWGFRHLHDIDDTRAVSDLARTSVLMVSFVAQSARGPDLPVVPQRTIDTATSVAERFLVRWRGETDRRHVEALDAYLVLAAEHGLNAATTTARIIASTGADAATCLAGAVAAGTGPLQAGSTGRVLRLLNAVAEVDDAGAYLRGRLDSGREISGFRHAVYRGHDPRAAIAREVCRRFDAPLLDVALAVEDATVSLLRERRPESPVGSTLDFWVPVLLSVAEIPPSAHPALFACARSAGWSAHILEQKREGRMIRPLARYDGPPPRHVTDVAGWDGPTTPHQ